MAASTPLELGMVSLGRMGANLVRRAMSDGHRCAGTDVNADAVRALAEERMAGAASAKELVAILAPPRAVWVMVPAGEITERAVAELGTLLEAEDTVIDGGNTLYDDIRRARELGERGIHYVDVGTSGGVFGLEQGFCLMVGGRREPVARLAPLFASLAPGLDAAQRTPAARATRHRRSSAGSTAGRPAQEHFVKMVHNGIRVRADGRVREGLNLLHHAGAGDRARVRRGDRPLDNPDYYRYDLDVAAAISEVWRRGGVVASWLLDLTAAALHESPGWMTSADGCPTRGERWTSIAAIGTGTPAPVLTAALFQQFSSRGRRTSPNRVLSAMQETVRGARREAGALRRPASTSNRAGRSPRGGASGPGRSAEASVAERDRVGGHRRPRRAAGLGEAEERELVLLLGRDLVHVDDLDDLRARGGEHVRVHGKEDLLSSSEGSTSTRSCRRRCTSAPTSSQSHFAADRPIPGVFTR